MALYRKYRPATFADVVGQEHITGPLSQALNAGRINHAYLFSGPRGCGKTSSARILARSLNCVHGPTSSPCGQCESCLALAPGGPGSLDVTELDAASHRGVDDMRDLRDRAIYAPAESRYRVFIIDEAHMITKEGFNALLKIVEEPPEHLVFIFATTEPEKVLTTIKSRTHQYPFRLLAPNDMRGLLERICRDEHVRVEASVYPLVIRAGGGSPRDSLSVLDQLLAGADDHGITYAHAAGVLGITDCSLIDAAVDAVADNNPAGLFTTITKVLDAGHDPRRFATDLVDRFRDLLVLQSIPDAFDHGLVDAPLDQRDALSNQAQVLGPATLTRCAAVVSDGLNELKGATSPRLLLEIMCARMVMPGAADGVEALAQRVELLERGRIIWQPKDKKGDDKKTGERANTPGEKQQGRLSGEVAGADMAASSPLGLGGGAHTMDREALSKYLREQAMQQEREIRAREAHERMSKIEEREGPAVVLPESASAPSASRSEMPGEGSAGEASAGEGSMPADGGTSDGSSAEGRTDAAGVAEAHSADDTPTGHVGPTPSVDESTEGDHGGLAADDLRPQWTAIKQAVGTRSKVAHVMVSEAVVLGVFGNHVVLGHHTGALAQRLNDGHNNASIADAITEATGHTVTVEAVIGTDDAALQRWKDAHPDHPRSAVAANAAATAPTTNKTISGDSSVGASAPAPASAFMSTTAVLSDSARTALTAAAQWKKAQEQRKPHASTAEQSTLQSAPDTGPVSPRIQSRTPQSFSDGSPLPPEPEDDPDSAPPEDYHPRSRMTPAPADDQNITADAGSAPGVADHPRGVRQPVDTEYTQEEAEEEMATASRDDTNYDRRSAKEIAMELLINELGAQPL